jgi:hypothetical protein
MRIYLGTVEVAGYCARLHKGFERIGVAATYGVLRPHAFGYGVEEQRLNAFVRGARAAHLGRARAQRQPLLRAAYSVLFAGWSVAVFIWAALRHDVFVFTFAESFFRLAELPVLRLMGKKIVFVFFGSDARPAYLDGAQLAADPRLALDMKALEHAAHRQRKRIARIERHAHFTVNTPPTGFFHTKPFAIWLMIGMPIDALAAPADAQSRAPLRMVHAPSAEDVKGSPAIRSAIARLRERGLPLDLVELTGRSNEAVQAEIAQCDAVIDQMYSDSPMAMLAAEAASHGKPVVVGGYYAERLDADLPPDAIPPTVYCKPEAIESAIEQLARDEAHRRALGEACRDFILRRFRPEMVAANYVRLLRNELGPEYFYDPVARLRHVAPMGMDIASARALVSKLIGQRGPSALHLDHNPELRASMQRFAAGTC